MVAAHGTDRRADGQTDVQIDVLAGRQELAPLLAQMHGQCFGDSWSAENFAGILIHRGAGALVMSIAGQPCGFAVTQLVADEAEILTIGVLPRQRRAGLGRLVLADTMTRLAGAGCRSLFLEVAEDNHAALRLYQGAGFCQAGRRAQYYRNGDGSRTDALILRATLGAYLPSHDAGGA